MAYYFFDIADNKIEKHQAHANISALEYKYFEKPSGDEHVYYKLTDGIITNIICEAKDETLATAAIEKFLIIQALSWPVNYTIYRINTVTVTS